MLRLIALPLLLPIQGTPSAPVSVRGEILPHQMASVELHAVSNPFAVSAIAGPDGRFRFKNVQPGTYTLSISTKLGGEVRKTVEISTTVTNNRGEVPLVVQVEGENASREGANYKISAREWQIPERAVREYQEAQKRISRHDFDGARESLKRAVEIEPRFAAAWNQLGTMAYQDQRYGEAESCFRRGLEADPEAYEPLVNLGGVLLNLGKSGDALQYNTEAVRRRPQDALGQSQLGMTYALLNQLDAAEKHLTLATRLDPNHFSHPQISLAEVYARKNQPGRAAEQLQDFLRGYPDWPAAAKMRELIAEWRTKGDPIPVPNAGEQGK